MGFPSACDECGKKFKVFGTKKKCKHCKDVVCKGCLAIHLELKHTNLNRAGQKKLRRRKSFGHFEADEAKEIKSFSARRSPSPPLESESVDSSILESVDGIEAVSDDDDDGDLYDDDTEQDAEDEMLMTTLSRQSSIEEKTIQYKELCKMQQAVATWAIKEKQAKQKMRCSEEDSYHCTIVPAVCNHETYSAMSVSYAVTVTVIVWTLFGLLVALYLRTRSLFAGSSHVL